MQRYRNKPKPERIINCVDKEVKKLSKKPPGPYVMPDVPVGEDSVSFERHNRVLRSEWTKSNRNAVVIEQLMECTFALRRRDILEDSTDVLTKYPFLQEPIQVKVYNLNTL